MVPLSLAQKVVAEEPTSMRMVPLSPVVCDSGPLVVEEMEKLGKRLSASVTC